MLSNHTLIVCEIRDEFGHVESAAHRDTLIEAVGWFTGHGITFNQVKWIPGSSTYTYQRPNTIGVEPARRKRSA